MASLSPQHGISRRRVLAGAVALPWLVACGPGSARPAGVDRLEGTFDAGSHTERYWTAHAGAQLTYLRTQST